MDLMNLLRGVGVVYFKLAMESPSFSIWYMHGV